MGFSVTSINSKRNAAVLIAVGLGAGAIAVLAPGTGAEEADKRWQAVAPGRDEPWSGEVKISAGMIGRISEVMVKVNDKVFEGELLVRLDDDEARSRLATAEAQVALRKRARNDQSASARASDRRKAEDAAFDAARAVVEARAALDRAAAARRADNKPDGDLEAPRTALTRALDRLRQDKAELRRIEGDSGTPLPSQTEGQLNIARTELLAGEAAVEKSAIRASIASTVLQVNAKAGELASPNATQPLVLLGDLSALRVRAELDERDFGEIKIGQVVLVRAAAVRGREFAGKVSSIAPIVDAGRINARGQRNLNDVNVVEVLVDLSEPAPLAVGMKVDVYFRQDSAPKP
ncbi:MAG: HlyD family secretion protein [Alphaproteobacteria bacterium]|nr:HlyD family secretion protein [Alphaproteobacteria bacterium]